ncbi:hypothetical protein OSB04_015061 [Centaurea solstitialis]|uniref:Glucose-methanol-choline oxidoreductase N-terminal domain-containing protein n=1 Tax=Centaurea solstitialis TaxID=347529 RepID=A0AA38WJR7_9ASTR|nr:hypothetical protein OSB04_015061 [Centaurea solstitialis]
MSPLYRRYIAVMVADGSQSSFWHDKAVGHGISLCERFPRLFSLEVNKRATFKERWSWVNGAWQGTWEWRTILRGRSLEDFNNLVNLLLSSDFKISGTDTWRWSWENKDESYLGFTYEATDFTPAHEYDYIIVGGGTAGCPLAATLSEKFSVLLLERGGVAGSDPNVLYETNLHYKKNGL